jgi:hypothetical protein
MWSYENNMMPIRGVFFRSLGTEKRDNDNLDSAAGYHTRKTPKSQKIYEYFSSHTNKEVHQETRQLGTGLGRDFVGFVAWNVNPSTRIGLIKQ